MPPGKVHFTIRKQKYLLVLIMVFTFVNAANQSGSSRKVRRLFDFTIGWILFASTMLSHELC